MGPHPPLKCRQKAIPAAHYPGKMNHAIAEVIHRSFTTGIKRKMTANLNSQKVDVHGRNVSDLPIPKMLKHTPDEVSVEQVVGGLRNPYSSLNVVPGLINLGVQVRNCIKSFCDRHPGIKKKFLGSLGHSC